MSGTPNYASAAHIGSASINTADTSLTAPSSVGTVFSAAANGSRVDRATIQATGTTTQGLVRLFLHDGATYRLIAEIPVLPVVPSSTQAAFHADVTFDGGLNMQTGWSLRATCSKSEAFMVTAFGGDF